MESIRDHPAVHHNAGLELDELWVFAVGLREAADFGRLPAVDRDVERHTRLEAGDEARHDGQAVGAMAMRELGIGNNMACHLEFLNGDFGLAARREEEDVPVFVAHCVDGGAGEVAVERRKDSVGSRN